MGERVMAGVEITRLMLVAGLVRIVRGYGRGVRGEHGWAVRPLGLALMLLMGRLACLNLAKFFW